MYLTDKYYPNFFAANDGRKIPGRMTLMGGVKLSLHVRPAPQYLPKANHCTDLDQVARTLNEAECLLDRLRLVARRVELEGHLLSDMMTPEDE
jgi:hypothetical protein